MRYISTRGKSEAQNFLHILLSGTAPDGGLYVPESVPQFSRQEIASWKGCHYHEIAWHIMHPFIGSDIPAPTLQKLLRHGWDNFRHPAIAPLIQWDEHIWLLELFYGPTMAFKDYSLAVLGTMIDYVLNENGQRAVLLAATSGDTGSAAIEGFAHSKQMDIVILHPHGKISEIQRRQMTTVTYPHVHNIAIEGNFDDCQKIIKHFFQMNDLANRRLIAANSINWGRIMCQIIYYFTSALSIGSTDTDINYTIPSGNFGNAYAAHLARKMGLPIHKIHVAVNSNHIVHHFFQTGEYRIRPAQHTISPSMDVAAASNFERLLFEICEKDSVAVSNFIQQQETGCVTVPSSLLGAIRQEFSSCSISDEATMQMMERSYLQHHYLPDPHTAVGLSSQMQLHDAEKGHNNIVLATAHPAKFPQQIPSQAPTPQLPAHLSDLTTRPERYTRLPNNFAAVRQHLLEQL